MAKKKEEIPEYGHLIRKGKLYYRTRLRDEDGKQIELYGKTCEELFQKVQKKKAEIADAKFRKENPTVEEYAAKWLHMHSAHIRPRTLDGYARAVKNYIVKPLGHMYMKDVTADDIKMAMVPVSKLSAHTYATVNMLFKSIFYSAEYSKLITYNPSKKIPPKGGTSPKERFPLSDEQVNLLLDTVKELPPYLFVMIGLYAGLRREEILALQWDCVFLDEKVPYISVRRAWHSEHNRPVVNTDLKTAAARRDIPIPSCLVKCLREEKEKSNSDFVISDSNGNPLAETQFMRLWNYIKVRTTKERTIYRYINGQAIRHQFYPEKGERCRTDKNLYYCLDFVVSPHILRHTYITNLIAAGVDPKTVQYLAGHKNSQVTMDIYAKMKYNTPEELSAVVQDALKTTDGPRAQISEKNSDAVPGEGNSKGQAPNPA